MSNQTFCNLHCCTVEKIFDYLQSGFDQIGVGSIYMHFLCFLPFWVKSVALWYDKKLIRQVVLPLKVAEGHLGGNRRQHWHIHLHRILFRMNKQ